MNSTGTVSAPGSVAVEKSSAMEPRTPQMSATASKAPRTPSMIPFQEERDAYEPVASADQLHDPDLIAPGEDGDANGVGDEHHCGGTEDDHDPE